MTDKELWHIFDQKKTPNQALWA